MPPFLNNPLPSNMRSECKKCGHILASFIDPRQSFGPDKIIPPEILANAKGLAVLTVFKAGFLGSLRGGSGIVVARLPDGSWSAPSAIGTVGGGFGGQIGFELTDFVFILNDANAVKTLAQAGSLTLGGNVSVAAGPVGRNAEAAAAASLKAASGVFAYSRTKGLFAGVSLEGSGFIERKDANQKMYNARVTARELLGGKIPPPPQAEPLMRVLNSSVFNGKARGTDDIYNDVPVYDDDLASPSATRSAGADDDYTYSDRAPARASTWADDPYDRASARAATAGRADPNTTFDRLQAARDRSSTIGDQSDYTYSDRKTAPPPGRPTAPKPKIGPKPGQAIAKFNFDADQKGDLGFKKGDIITILKRTDNETDWWTGRIGDREGIFPSNYVQLS
ncbi:hypothetical protein AMS68_007504 [Peltaster fructicola]|uniref:SH3 domain-containing protein n=1 Tax=Peltaster fructicola TaxID=286661 RepID=A0A6H0Y4M9_9PEZI|nr:hypothetical protein AMS68_007504 [Peltaster fructicola]